MSQMIESFMNRGAPEPPLVQAVALDELPGGAGRPLAPAVNPLHAVKVRLQVRVGEATLTVGDLLAARENQVLALDRTVDQPVDLVLEGKVVARGQLVAVDQSFAVRITELPVPLQF